MDQQRTRQENPAGRADPAGGRAPDPAAGQPGAGSEVGSGAPALESDAGQPTGGPGSAPEGATPPVPALNTQPGAAQRQTPSNP
jgi:hypothetical protein